MIRNHSRHGSRFPVTSTSVPGAPTIGTATATGTTTATVSFTQPSSDGGSTITSYTATSSPGGITGVLNQAGSGTITVTGLTASTSYTFTVTATNAIGTSAPSAASNSITTLATDPYWANVSMLLHGDGTNAAQNNTFLDGSTNNFTVTRFGNTTQGSFNPFVATYPYDTAVNGGSAYLDGTGDYLSLPSNAAFQFPINGSFTIECWIRLTTTGVYQYAYSAGTATGATDLYFGVYNTNVMAFVVSSGLGVGSYLALGTTALVANTWYHIAVTRSTSTVRFFLNGAAETIASTSGTSSVAMPSAAGPAYVGTYFGTASFLNGYISNLRVVNGTAIYTAAFTPPTAPLTAVTNTALLLGFTNGAIYDNTMLNNLETVGNSQISTSTFKYGTGALKFGATATDYMPTRKTSALTLGSSDFTIECWVNFAPATANGYFAGDYDGTTNFNFYMYVASGTLRNTWRQSGGGNIACVSSAGAIVINTWYHIAFVRDGNTNRQYINGVQNGTVSVTGLTADTNANPMVIGNIGSAPIAPYFNGYIDDFRFTKGVCRYPSGTTFTPPTAAFPNS